MNKKLISLIAGVAIVAAATGCSQTATSSVAGTSASEASATEELSGTLSMNGSTSMEKVIMGYFANPGLVKTQIAMSLGRSADDASILQREYSRWDSHGQYTVIICLRYYPSIQVLDKLTQFEALTVEDMEKSLSKCCTRNDRIWIKDVYSDRLFTIRKSIAEIKKQLNIL